MIDFPKCFVNRNFRSAVKIVNNINHGYQGKYLVKSLLIGIKRAPVDVFAMGQTNSQEDILKK